MNVPAVRLCFLDEKPTDSDGKAKSDAYPKGYLDLWEFDKPGYTGFSTTGNGMGKYNHVFWDHFKKAHKGSEQEQITQEIFEEWYKKQTSSIEGQQSAIKNHLDK